MWSSERRMLLFTLAALPLVAACRFTPVHAPGGSGEALRGRVRADDPADRLAFAFVAALEDRLGRPREPRYDLAYEITVDERGGADVRDLGDTRHQIFGRIRFVLSDAASGDLIHDGMVQSFTAYSATATQLATRVAQEDAERRLMRILADQLVTRLVMVLERP